MFETTRTFRWRAGDPRAHLEHRPAPRPTVDLSGRDLARARAKTPLSEGANVSAKTRQAGTAASPELLRGTRDL